MADLNTLGLDDLHDLAGEIINDSALEGRELSSDEQNLLRQIQSRIDILELSVQPTTINELF